MSHRSTIFGRANRNAHLDPPRVRFRRAIVMSLMTLVVPGSAHLAMGKRVVGSIALAVWLGLGGALVVLYLRFGSDTSGVIELMTNPTVLLSFRIAIVALAIGWVLLFVDAWRLSAPANQPWYRTALVITLNVSLILGVAGVAAYASSFIGASRDLVQDVFTAKKTSSPLKGRYNILVMGTDSGDDRFGLRPDSLVVASIDSSTGRTVLVSIPRNLQNVPFAEDSPMRQVYPNGFNCGSECLMNAVYTTAMERKDLYPDSESPGLEATFDAVEGVTGLKLNYYMMVNMAGFESLIDDVGGVEIDVKTRLPKFGETDAWKNVYLEPGRQTLNGSDALWYARSRYGSDDYARMGRQKCLMSAMLDQMTPATVITNAVEMAQSGKELLSGNIPRQELGPFGELALKARNEKMKTVSLVPPEVDPVAPDFEAVRATIAAAINESESGSSSPPTSGSPTASTSPSGSPTSPTPSQSSPTGDVGNLANNSDDLAAAC